MSCYTHKMAIYSRHRFCDVTSPYAYACVGRPSENQRDVCAWCDQILKKSKGSAYSIAESKVPELIPVHGSQPAGDVSHKPVSRLPLLSTRPAITPATLKRAATDFAAW